MVELLALGPLELWHDQQQHELGSLKERCVLAVLIHARGEPVSADALMDRVWDGDPPPTAVDTLHSYLSRLRGRLRRAVGDDRARVERPSSRLYQLRADPEDIDLLRFQRLRSDAVAAAARGEHELAIGLLRTAETLWRSEPLTEFADSSWAQAARARLIEDHRRVREERIGLEMELGRHADLVGELQELASQSPFAQKVIGSLMLVLYRSGRHDEALAVYRNTRARLHESQGIEPAAELQQLHLRMLEQDRGLLRTTAEPPVSAPSPEPRNCLPRDIRDFTGRVGELRILLNESAAEHGRTSALPVTVIHGMPGIGKTSLAVRAAHELSTAYPAGQFYVDMRGYSGQQPLDPADALANLLHSAGWPGELPATLDERATRWREWTARRRALVVLDNVRDAAQVGPLLPGSPTCRVLVTTRSRLAGLDGATDLFVDTLSRTEAAALFTRIVGASRVATEPGGLRQIVDACACHPLALQILASRFRHRESWDLQHLLDRLTHASDPLQEFDGLMTAVFQCSYTELSGPVRELFRLLALHSGPDITLRAAAALAGPDFGSEPGLLERCVEDLLDSSLLEEPVRGRYRLHDLTRAFALQAGVHTDSDKARHAAAGRLISHYVTTAHRADRLAHPHRRAMPLPPDQESRHAPTLSGPDEASAWLTVERGNLMAVARTAAAEHPEYAALFPRVLARSLKLWGAWDIAAELFDAAVPALRASGDRSALARTLTDHADLLAQRNHGEALRCATEALAIHEDLHDAYGRADALFQSGRAHLAAGHGGTALRVLEQSLKLYREVGDRSGEADCLNVEGAVLHYAGQYAEALHKVEQMGAIYEELSDPHGLAQALNNRGELHFLQKRYAEARDCYERSLVLMRQHGGRCDLAILDTNLGAVHQAVGQTDQALTYFKRALAAHRASGDALGEADVLISMGTAYAESGRRGEALLHLTMAEQVATAIDNPFETLRAMIGAADVQRESGRLDTASKGYEQALEVARRINFPMGSAHALAGLARTASLSHRPVERAVEYGDHGEQAVALYRSLGAETEAVKLLRFLTRHRSTGS
ncbi:tetratricopeptide repeat protein [Streptomyces sp. SID12501]|uniref:Tetratricopeptide repeat protein n=1 Tax=Streptomyces sp. SID12501 TaxID=2706042 RepID=A0A6B3BQW4_9ACTN|nr:tetratricopeptide repeat protein [Streptomyces sp. SID12501]NEC86710.1 tetratricopeptide repeat protein [Streptomyces sp. SID12501]